MCPTEKYPRFPAIAAAPAKEAEAGALLHDVFTVLDADGDGKIGPDDLHAFYTCFSGEEIASQDNIDDMISAADANDSGFIEFEEFSSILNQKKKMMMIKKGNVDGGALPPPSSPERRIVEDVFRAMDRDGDGIVGVDDLKGYLELVGFPATEEEEIRAMLKMGGGDGSKGVDLEGLERILTVDLVGGGGKNRKFVV